MAHSTIFFRHPASNERKAAPVGMSWATLFFGFFPALFRGQYKNAAIIFFVTAGALMLTGGWGAPVSWVVFSLSVDRMCIGELLAQGYVVETAESARSIE